MDNLTHTLIGALVGEAAAARSSQAGGGLTNLDRRKLFVPAMAIGSGRHPGSLVALRLPD